jgi:CheY-like chemotaxis protein
MTTTATNSPVTRILCVDDNPTITDMLALHLQRHAYEVETSPDGLAAWRLISANPTRFDAVITDNQMPHMEGIDLVEKLRANGFPGAIVFFSSTLAPQSAERLARLRIDAVIEKGRPISELMTALRHAVS